MSLFEIIFFFVWAMFPVLWFFVLRIGGMDVKKLSIPTFLVISILLSQYIGFPILYYKWDSYRAEFVTDMDTLMLAWLGTSASTMLLCLGATIASKFLGKRCHRVEPSTAMSELPSYIVRRIYLLCAVCVGILLLYVNKIGFQNLAITLAISQASQADVNFARSMMGNAFEGGYHWYNFFMRDALIFSMLVLFANRTARKDALSMWILILVTCCAVFSLTMATEKGLAVDFMISIFLMHVCVKHNGVVPVKWVLALGLAIVGVLSAFYLLLMGDRNFYMALASIISRGLTGSIQPIYHYLDYFPKHHDWLYGSSMPNPGGIFPFTPFDLTINVMNFIYPEHYQSGVVGTMPAIYWGEIYANFGWLAVLIAPAFIGIALCLVNYFISRVKKTPMSLAFFVWLLLHYKNLSITSLSSFLFDLQLYLIIFIYILLAMPRCGGGGAVAIKRNKI